jgi:hypothetical protein
MSPELLDRIAKWAAASMAVTASPDVVA